MGMPIFLEQPARCECRNGMVHFIWDGDLDLALPIGTCIANIVAAEAAIAKWQLAQMGNASETVVALRR